ncbi:hypothetical protein PAP_09600 [Palaeococcus pacificus DY20341]|uniref:Uncharacterized protein n=1 Tax=Palaeococcus pacificus DY20341 TaxID=1343739 RepID=A0A075LUA3_9EURY|nr:hypothetical protein [Palaeococcus pacificus]AIF70295.1 hypothetical protein PAP_09600 [Palaeococcus pacificus DY20341]
MKLTQEQEMLLKIVLPLIILSAAIIGGLWYRILSHQTVPYDLVAPKGAIYFVGNVSLGDYTQENAVDLQGILVLKGNTLFGKEVEIGVQEGWCVDLVVWDGKKYEVKEKCASSVKLSMNAFYVTQHYYWYMERGYHLVLHKKDSSPIAKYERVYINTTVEGETKKGSLTLTYKE